MPDVPRLLFPVQSTDPRRALLLRLGAATGIVAFIAAITWLGRGGYHDDDGTSVTLLDAVYYATVTATTTGYGDIAPVSTTARAVTAFVVTPCRILFLIVLVGTTIELLTERFRHARAEARWRRTVNDHTIIAGYGTMGRGVVETLLAGGTTTRDQIVVIDPNGDAVGRARAAGLTTIMDDGTRTASWIQARIETARSVVVTCNRDDTATLATLTARELNRTVPIAAAVREAENAHLLSQSGATTVVLSSESAGRLLGLSTDAPRAVSVLEDLLLAGSGLEIVEQATSPDEVGGPPRSGPGRGIPIALVRGARRISYGDPAFQQVQQGDIVVSIADSSSAGLRDE